jgi:hypothetical protein
MMHQDTYTLQVSPLTSVTHSNLYPAFSKAFIEALLLIFTSPFKFVKLVFVASLLTVSSIAVATPFDRQTELTLRLIVIKEYKH